MTLSLTNPATWGVGDQLTSSQINQLDATIVKALDKTSGSTDTLSSVVSLAVAGRIVENVATGANADTTYLVGAANRVIRVTSAVTANRVYTLSATGVVTGDQLTIYCEPSFVTYEITIKDQAAASMYTLGNLASSDGQWATFIYVGGWRLFRASGAGGAKAHTQVFTDSLTPGTWTCPANVFRITLTGCGGGGGGGAGNSTSLTTADRYSTGGSGGGGALLSTVEVDVVPGVGYAVVIGAGGAAGLDGADTTFGSLATFTGAGKGLAGSTSANTTYEATMGGSPTRAAVYGTTRVVGTASAAPPMVPTPASGGFAITNQSSTLGNGNCNPYGGFAGGAGGARGVDSSTYRGGGGSGGGGAGPFGDGGAGGVGSDGNNGGAASNATAGTAAGANTGAGGGGGGCPGHASGAGAAAGAGGAGGSGKLIVMWVK